MSFGLNQNEEILPSDFLLYLSPITPQRYRKAYIPSQASQEGMFLRCSSHASALRLHEELLFAVKVLVHPFAFLGSVLNR